MMYAIKCSKGLLTGKLTPTTYSPGNFPALFSNKKYAMSVIKNLRQRYPERKYGKIHLIMASEETVALAVIGRLKG